MSLFAINYESEIKAEYGQTLYKLDNTKLKKSVLILATKVYSNQEIGRFIEKAARHLGWNLPDCVLTDEGAPKNKEYPVNIIFDEYQSINWVKIEGNLKV